MPDVFGDTNLLLRSVQPDHPLCPVALQAIRGITERGDRFVLAHQNLVEFRAVATRPSGSPNGLGLSSSDARSLIDGFVQNFTVLTDNEAAFSIWLNLVSRYGVSGRPTHDARLVATMLANGVTRVLTFNGKDFARFAEITVETP